MAREDTDGLLIRRARLRLGMTQEQFAQIFGVESCTVSRWEHGKMRPSPATWREIRRLSVDQDNPLSEESIENSKLFKYLSPMNAIFEPVAVSKAVRSAVKKEINEHFLASCKHPLYHISGLKVLEIVSSHPEWLIGGIVCAEAKAIGLHLGGIWIDLMVTALLDRRMALIEYAPAFPQEGGKFELKITFAKDFGSSNANTFGRQFPAWQSGRSIHLGRHALSGSSN